MSITCPVCRSSEVKGFKHFDGKEYWHKCISGINHGAYEFNGEVKYFEQYLWFSDSNLIKAVDGKIIRTA